jgi:hypothetical protein
MANRSDHLISAGICIVLGKGVGHFFLEAGIVEAEIGRPGKFG